MDSFALTAYVGTERTLECGCAEVPAVERWIDSEARFRRQFVLVIVPKPGCEEHDRDEVSGC